MKILVVEDDPILNKNIKETLQASDYQVETVYDGLLAERLLKKENFECIILDINLPGKTGYDLCKSFRTYNNHTPVLMLTAFDDIEDKIKGFESGTDDYLTKPFLMKELLLRVHALIKRSKMNNHSEQDTDTLFAGDITIQIPQKKVFRQGKEIVLTPREFQILKKLCENKGEIVSKKDLIAEIWGNGFDANTNTIEVYVNFLRNKMDKPFEKNSIKTKVGYGYYLEIE